LKRYIALFLTSALLVGTLFGCGNTAPTPTTAAPATEAAAPPEPVPATAPVTAPSTVSETVPVRNTDSDLLAILSGTYPVMTEFGIQQPLGEYLWESYTAIPIAFTLLDMNGDGENEMVLETDSYVSTYVVIHLERDTAYAYPFGSRELGRLKADGSFAGSSSAFNSLYMTMDFADGTYFNTVLAECEYSEGWFTLGGEACTQADYEQFSQSWEQQPGANWIALAVPETEPTDPPTAAIPYLEKIPRADQPIFREPSYDSQYVGTVQLAGVYTIVEEQWDDEGNLWGRLKSGVGWVDLTDSRGSHPLVTVSFLDQALINSGNYHHCIGETGDYLIQCVFRVSSRVTNVRIYDMVFDGMELVPDRLVYTLDRLTPDKPLVADISLPGDMSVCGFCCTDENGVEREFAVSVSGRNGMLTIAEAKQK